MSEPWADYLESIDALASMPGRERARQRRAEEDEASAVAAAKVELAARIRECREWEQLAARAQATAEARLVSAQVLLPDAAGRPALPTGSPEELAEALRAAELELVADLSGLDDARRAAKGRADEDAVRAARLAERRKLLIKYGGIALIVLALVLAVVLR